LTSGIVYVYVDPWYVGSIGFERKLKTMNADRVMDNIRNAFERSGITLNELGQGLGYDGPTATKRAWSLLYRTSDPRISTLLAVAKTLGVKIGDLVN
jgi:hypothetical protein